MRVGVRQDWCWLQAAEAEVEAAKARFEAAVEQLNAATNERSKHSYAHTDDLLIWFQSKLQNLKSKITNEDRSV